MPALEVRSDDGSLQVHRFSGSDIWVGRGDSCTIRIDARNVSRRHCRFLHLNGVWYIEDANSLNGTFVNGERLLERRELKDGDRVHVYKVATIFHVDEPPERAVRAADDAGEVDPSEVTMRPSGPREPVILHELEVDPNELPKKHADRKLVSVFELMHRTPTLATVDEMLPKFLELLFALFPQSERAHVIYSGGGDKREILYADKTRGDEPAGQTSLGPLRNAIAEQAITTHRAFLGVDFPNIPADADESDSIFSSPNRSTMYAPLLALTGKAKGVAYLDTSNAEQRFDSSDLETLATVTMMFGHLLRYC